VDSREASEIFNVCFFQVDLGEYLRGLDLEISSSLIMRLLGSVNLVQRQVTVLCVAFLGA
jgi:hypothetical protein